MPDLSVASISAACDIATPVSLRQDFLGAQPGALKDPLAARQAECRPWDVIGQAAHMAIHAALMSTGEIMFFGGWFRSTGLYVFDPRSEKVDTVPRTVIPPADAGGTAQTVPDTNMFCADHAHLANGKLLVAGGHLPRLQAGEGIDAQATQAALENDPNAEPVLLHEETGMDGGGDNACYTYEPVRRTWTRVAFLSPSPDGPENSGGRWYPTLTTLFDNQVICVAGHPNRLENFPATGERRHNNNTPERYAPWNDTWTLLLAETTAIDSIRDEYPRQFLTKGGQIFFATQITQIKDANRVDAKNRFYDPYAGMFFAASIGPPGESIYHQGSRASAVLLPLLPANGYRTRVMISGGVQPFVIDLGHDHEDWESDSWNPPSWQVAGTRTGWGDDGPPTRSHACAVLLPDGTVFVSGGTDTPSGENDIRQSEGVRHGEIYDPDIDWATGDFQSNGNWTRVAAAAVIRHYHSVALLMPNGTVWTAGSNGPGGEADQELRHEVYRPPYCAMTGRPGISASPAALIYRTQFELRSPQAGAIRRVALMRNGSVTHAFDGDQRYVGLDFDHAGGDRLVVSAPPDSAIAPPGFYMIWIVDDHGRPCLWAPLVKVGALSVRRTVAECGVTAPLSLLSDVFGIGGNTVPSLRHQINDAQRTCIF